MQGKNHANLSFDTVNPVLLPTDHHLTNLVIKEVHSKMMHGGVASTLTAIRDNYWIRRGREAVKGFIGMVWYGTLYLTTLTSTVKTDFQEGRGKKNRIHKYTIYLNYNITIRERFERRLL